jgi:hypothetical protein
MGSDYTNSHFYCPVDVSDPDFRMACQPRFQYPGALYHVKSRGNGGDAVNGTRLQGLTFFMNEVIAVFHEAGGVNSLELEIGRSVHAEDFQDFQSRA